MIAVNAWVFMALCILSAAAWVGGVLYLGHILMHRTPKPPKPKSPIVVVTTAAVFDEVHRHSSAELREALNGSKVER